MTFWTKLQHELLCFVCAEDEIFDSAGDREGVVTYTLVDVVIRRVDYRGSDVV